MRPAVVSALLLGVSGTALAQADIPRDVVRLQGLDKVTARVSTFDVEVGATVRFGTLDVTAKACFVAPPTAAPESAAFLQIADNPPTGEPTRVFSGWMFASSPAVSALDHAVYDVWVIECLDRAPSAVEPPMTGEAAGEDDDAALEPRALPRRRPDGL
ncbi:MAG: DUF2155 domain-containing protein [Geminicoccaceae bacterium]|nr:MAG: DUF2155 domain-containing protein [Geminicoccaceae bacterium]